MHDASSLVSIADALRAGSHAQAEQGARSFLSVVPDHELALNYLAFSLHSQRRPLEAADVYRRLTGQFPQNREYWSNLATALRECGRVDEAESAYLHAASLAPADATLAFNIALLLMQKGDIPGSRDWMRKAQRLQPDSIEIRIYAAIVYFEAGENAEAQRLLSDWAQWRDVEPRLWLDLGWILGLLGHTEAAEDYLWRAMDISHGEDRVHAQARLTMLFERSNRLDDARRLVDQLPIADEAMDAGLRNDIVSARLAVCARNSDGTGVIAPIEALLRSNVAVAVRINLLFALARAHDRAGDPAAAMQVLHEAHDRQYASACALEPDLARPEAEPLARVARTIDAGRFHEWPTLAAPKSMESPIFIVGFPRSGTTMLEQMLDAHPLLCSMDERAFLQDLIDQMAAWNIPYPDGLDQLSQSQCDTLRASYWRLVDQHGVTRSGRRLVDKNPLNLLRLPLIARLFPRSPIVLALRHPCDVLLSCYMQNFRSPAFALLCRSLQRLAKGYVNAMRCWDFHANLMQPAVLTIRYEDILDDLPGHIAKFGTFLELDDVSSMLHFHEHARVKRFISTPSYTQVIRPPNKDSIGRWHAYRPWFEPIIPELRPIVRRLGYTDLATDSANCAATFR